jgi:hypothetical protein
MEEDVPKSLRRIKDENSSHFCIYHASLVGDSLRGGASPIVGVFFGGAMGHAGVLPGISTSQYKELPCSGVFIFVAALCASTI